MLVDKNRMPEVKRRIKQLTKRKIRVGILGNEQLALIAKVNEYGQRIKVTQRMRNYLRYLGLYLSNKTAFITIPERSFLRTSFDDKRNIKKVIDLAADIFTERPVMNIADRIGLFMTGAIQKKIKSNIPPGNHPFTTEQKDGKNKTLVDAGRLGQGITHKVL